MGTQVFCLSSVPAMALLAAAVDDGAFDDSTFGDGSPTRRVLLVASTAELPELVTAPQDVPGFAALARRFDEVLDWNAIIAPLHPAAWSPPPAELPMLTRLVRGSLGLDPDDLTELVVDDLASGPVRAVAALLPDCPVTVVSDSLLAWGPPSRALTGEQAGRATRLLHLPVLDGLRPLLLADATAAVECLPVPAPRLLAALAELPAARVAEDAALLVGEHPDDPAVLPAELLRAAAALGHRTAVLVPHAAGGPGDDRALHDLAGLLGVHLTITDDGLPAEAVLAASRPALVLGGVGPALILARDVLGLPVAHVGAERVLARRRPRPARIPATIVHAGVPTPGPDGALVDPSPLPESLAALVDTVAYSLAPDALAPLRRPAAAYLGRHGGGPYVDHDRQVALGLTGAPVGAVGRSRPGVARPALRRLARAARR